MSFWGPLVLRTMRRPDFRMDLAADGDVTTFLATTAEAATEPG
jgi:hypothetical protein